MEFHPVLPAGDIPASCDAGGALSGIVAIRPGDLRFPGSGMSALVAGPDAGRPVSGGEVLVFCHPVAAAPAVVRRGGAVQAAGWLPGHVTLGVLEAYLPAGEIEELVEDFGCWERRQRLLSSAMAVRLLIAAALIPDGDIPEVIRRVAGLLELLPWARPWHAPGTEALTRRLETIPAELFEALFWQVAGPAAGEDAPGMTWRGFLVCALDGFQVAVPDTDENRAYFGSSGTADNTAPFPQARGIIATAAGCRGTLGLEFGPSGNGEQTLTRRMARHHPEVFAAGRLFLIDRNFPGLELIKDIRQAGAHLLMRIKSDIALPLLEALPDGSYRSFLAGRDCCIPLRVIEYHVTVPGRDDSEQEMYALATTLTSWQEYPAGELAGLYPRRWGASETTIGQDKSVITGAGPSTGPILRSGTPHQVTQEMWAWITATQLLRVHGCRAAAPDEQLAPVRGPRTADTPPPAPGRLPFTLTRREAVRAMTQTLAPATLPAALTAAAERASRRILANLLPARPPRHRGRRVKPRPQFPAAGGRRVPASTGPTKVTLWHAARITYADGHTEPTAAATATPGTS
jgi:Insertion element 4 transposase N-terminal/Transposase DDE domain